MGGIIGQDILFFALVRPQVFAGQSSSSFEASNGNAIQNSIDWLTGALLGSVAIALCVLAMAFVGFGMLSGRLQVRHGMRVVLGCFVLLSAPVIAAALMRLASEDQVAEPPLPPVAQTELGSREDLPPSDYDPYGGASLRQD